MRNLHLQKIFYYSIIYHLFGTILSQLFMIIAGKGVLLPLTMNGLPQTPSEHFRIFVTSRVLAERPESTGARQIHKNYLSLWAKGIKIWYPSAGMTVMTAGTLPSYSSSCRASRHSTPRRYHEACDLKEGDNEINELLDRHFTNVLIKCRYLQHQLDSYKTEGYSIKYFNSKGFVHEQDSPSPTRSC